MHNMEFQYCLEQYFSFQWWGYGESAGDPVLIPSSSPEDCSSTTQTGFGPVVRVRLQSAGDPVLIPSSLGGCSSSVLLLAVFRWSGCTWCARSQMEESGHPWACLNISRSFGLRHSAGMATHVGAGLVKLMAGPGLNELEEVREQLGGQGVLCIEVCWLYGVGGTTQLPIGGWYFPAFHG